MARGLSPALPFLTHAIKDLPIGVRHHWLRPINDLSVGVRHRQQAAQAIGTSPRETRFQARLRRVLAADPAGVAERVEAFEQERQVDLAVLRLVAAGHARELHMADDVVMLGERRGEIALGDLQVVEVELQADVGRADALDQRARLGGRGVEVAGYVTPVERLEQETDTLCLRLPGCRAQVGDEDVRALGPRHARRNDPGHDVDHRRPQPACIVEGLGEGGFEIALAPGQRRQPALTRRPVAGWRVDEQELEAGVSQRVMHLGNGMIVGKEDLGGAKTERPHCRTGRRERLPAAHGGEVGGKTRHRRSLPSINVLTPGVRHRSSTG